MSDTSEVRGAWPGCRRLLLSFGLALAAVIELAACEPIGQSGSEGYYGAGGTTSDVGGDPMSCPCEAQGVFLRVTLLDRKGPDAHLRVDAVLHGASTWNTGQELHATDGGQLPCFLGTSSIDVGGEALAVFEPAPDADAAQSSAARGSVRMTPWADELLLAATAEGGLSVRAAELDELWGHASECRARHGDWSQLPGAFDGGVIP